MLKIEEKKLKKLLLDLSPSIRNFTFGRFLLLILGYVNFKSYELGAKWPQFYTTMKFYTENLYRIVSPTKTFMVVGPSALIKKSRLKSERSVTRRCDVDDLKSTRS